MAKKSLTGKRYFEWLGREHDRQGFSENLFYDIYRYRIKMWPAYAQQAYIITRIRSFISRHRI